MRPEMEPAIKKLAWLLLAVKVLYPVQVLLRMDKGVRPHRAGHPPLGVLVGSLPKRDPLCQNVTRPLRLHRRPRQNRAVVA